MKFRSFLVLVSASFLAFACGKDKDSNKEISGAIQQTQAGDTNNTANENNEAMLSPSGETRVSSTIKEFEGPMLIEYTGDKNAELDKIIAAHPDLARDVTSLRSIDRVVETDQGTYDLYAGDRLLMIVGAGENGDLILRESAMEFKPERIVARVTQTEQGEMTDALNFAFRNCVAEVIQEQVQEEDKVEAPVQGQDKGETPVQEQDKETPVQEQGKEETPVQEQQKEETREICATIEVNLYLEQVLEEEKTPVQEQEQEEKKEVAPPVQEEEKKETPVQEEEKVETPVQEQEKKETPVQEEEKVETPVQEQEKKETPVQEEEKKETPVQEQEKKETPVQEEEKKETPVQEDKGQIGEQTQG
ncbi:MAG: hypothetical protein AB7G93_06160 [Bdellovibrionales bacterium]